MSTRNTHLPVPNDKWGTLPGTRFGKSVVASEPFYESRGTQLVQCVELRCECGGIRVRPVTTIKLESCKLGFTGLCKKCSTRHKATLMYEARRKGTLLSNDKKKCCRCLQLLPACNFGHSGRTKDKLAPHCEDCCKDMALRRNFGISLEEYKEKLVLQNGGCFICGQKPRKRQLAVDHNHATGQVRSLLCNLCNRLVGCAREQPEILRRAATYIEDWSERK